MNLLPPSFENKIRSTFHAARTMEHPSMAMAAENILAQYPNLDRARAEIAAEVSPQR